ncbi:type II toxin-antitoxin system RelE/ParE family toxin [Rhizobium sp. LC145]|uniref:type II toxin-antitoxin system RelE/ParE family toxin n=1 Tax=Rhizobium sp. LC145 TaxID=1120688 RepID=UPI0009E4E459|nr:type II toxin-antitoxin system RelE/ParE family toxin [Rhizobium sp. LC145]
MKIDFASGKLRRQLESDKALRKAYGDRASRLKMRLAVLEQASNLSEVPTDAPDRCHQLDGEWAGCFAVAITGNWRLIFEPDHDPVPIRDDGGIDRAAVVAIRIRAIVDYH